MIETRVDRVHPESIVLDIGGNVGALLIYTDSTWKGVEIEVSPKGVKQKRVHVEVLERQVNGKTLFAAAYPELKEGVYEVWGSHDEVTDQAMVTGGEIAVLDWR